VEENVKLKSGVILPLFLVLFASVAAAGPIDCPSGSLADYIALGSPCTAGSLTLSAFGFLSTGDQTPGASDILVTPTALGLTFGPVSHWKIDGTGGDGKLQETYIWYLVQTPVSLVTLSWSAELDDSGHGQALFEKSFCSGAFSGTACDGGLIGSISGNGDSILLTPAANLGVLDYIKLTTDSGPGNKLASVNFIANTFTFGGPGDITTDVSNPEPVSIVLVGGGLLGLGILGRRRSKRS
jgi:hypothetical protein